MKKHIKCHLMALSAAVDAAACSFRRASCRVTLFRSCCSASHHSRSRPLSTPPVAVQQYRTALQQAHCSSQCRVPQQLLLDQQR
jgi:hypothetical protein